MLALFVLAAAVAQAHAPPVLPADWKPAAVKPQEYRQQVCACQPGALLDDLLAALHAMNSAVTARGTVTACDTTAEHLVVTGLSDARTRRNFDLYAYRSDVALVVIDDTFTKAEPEPADESAMLALCATAADRTTATKGANG